jgi:hypothetical protein
MERSQRFRTGQRQVEGRKRQEDVEKMAEKMTNKRYG